MNIYQIMLKYICGIHMQNQWFVRMLEQFILRADTYFDRGDPMKNFLTLTLVILLIISTGFSIKAKSDLDKYLINKDIKGTFISISDSAQKQIPEPNAQYFTFRKGKFYRYVQFKLMEEGTYKKIYDNVYILKSDTIADHIVYTNDNFYFYDRKEEDVLKFLKISDVPTFINVHVK